MDDEIVEIAFTRRSLKALNALADQLQAVGLEWIKVDDIAGHLAAVSQWQQGDLDLVGLCSRTGWPVPTPSGMNHSTPTAWAVQQAKQRLESAMLADHRAGASANEIAARVSGVFSRPTALKVLAGVLLMEQAVDALAPWFRREVPIHIFPGPADRRRTLELAVAWGDEAEDVRRADLAGVDEALSAVGLAMRDASTKASCTSEALIVGDRAEVELYRT